MKQQNKVPNEFNMDNFNVPQFTSKFESRASETYNGINSSQVCPTLASESPSCSPPAFSQSVRPSSVSSSVASRNPFLSDNDSGDETFSSPPPVLPLKRSSQFSNQSTQIYKPIDTIKPSSLTNSSDVFASSATSSSSVPYAPIQSHSQFKAPVTSTPITQTRTTSPFNPFNASTGSNDLSNLPFHSTPYSTVPPPIPPRDNCQAAYPPPPLPRRRPSTPSCNPFYSMAQNVSSTESPSEFAPPLPLPMRKTKQRTVSTMVKPVRNNFKLEKSISETSMPNGSDPFNCEYVDARLYHLNEKEWVKQEDQITPSQNGVSSNSNKDVSSDFFNNAFVKSNTMWNDSRSSMFSNTHKLEESIAMTRLDDPNRPKSTSTNDLFISRPEELRLSTLTGPRDSQTTLDPFSTSTSDPNYSSSVFGSSFEFNQNNISTGSNEIKQFNNKTSVEEPKSISSNESAQQLKPPKSELKSASNTSGPFNHYGEDHISPPERNIFRHIDDPFADEFFKKENHETFAVQNQFNSNFS